MNLSRLKGDYIMNNIRNNTQTGRSMIEMLAVLMIMGILTIGVMAGFNQMLDKYNAGKMHTDMMSISSEVVNLYSWQRSYPAINMEELCENDIFPDGCTDDSKAINPFDGEYILSTSAENQTLTIQATGVDSEACKDLCLREWDNIYTAPNCNDCEKGTFSVTFN